MCHKKLRQYPEAVKTYNILRDIIAKAEGKSLVRSVFSIITLFTTNDRDKKCEQLDNLATLMDFYGVPKYDSCDKIVPFYIP